VPLALQNTNACRSVALTERAIDRLWRGSVGLEQTRITAACILRWARAQVRGLLGASLRARNRLACPRAELARLDSWQRSKWAKPEDSFG